MQVDHDRFAPFQLVDRLVSMLLSTQVPKKINNIRGRPSSDLPSN
jgi:hypothetical protein